VQLAILILLFAATTSGVDVHWSFNPPVRPAIPALTASSSKNPRFIPRNSLDLFVLSALAKRGLAPSAQADKRTLIRRVTFDLTGLPPTPDETTAFIADRVPDAYEKVVKSLLASPRYGERWAQYWLDVVRFAETNGYETDGDRPQAWRYRDYVIRSLNDDKPYDKFIREQIAGDVINPSRFDAKVATGFLRAGPQHVVGGNQDVAVNRQEWLTEAVAGVGNAILGLTIGCARCHDHKYDPIPQADYYRLQAFFASTNNKDYLDAPEPIRKSYEAALTAQKERIKPIAEKVAAIEKSYRNGIRKAKQEKLPPEYAEAMATESSKRTPEQRKLAEHAQNLIKVEWDELVAALTPPDREARADLRRQIHEIESSAPDPPQAACGVKDSENRQETRLLLRGDPHTPGPVVQPGFPRVLASTAQLANYPITQLPRLTLADWITSSNNPLTARVIVNRLWQRYFGRGIVETPSDFGYNGKRPSNPELLDWLATELVRQRWSLKRLHYLIVTSATYRQSSDYDPQKARVDPDNRLVWRMNRAGQPLARDTRSKAAHSAEHLPSAQTQHAAANARRLRSARHDVVLRGAPAVRPRAPGAHTH